MNSPKSLYSLLEKNGPVINQLTARVTLLQRLSRVLAKSLPQSISQHCHIGNIVGKTLLIYADTPAWAAKLRYLSPSLPEHLNTALGTALISDIRIKVQPVTADHKPLPQRGSLKLSQENAEILEQTAIATTDEKLKAALKRLAKRGQRKA